jgi:aerobic carbon-monoxide dehydrogenase small subunit
MNEKTDITLTINGRDYPIRVEARKTLVDAIRDDCGQTGTHIGCEHGVCGTCTVIVDDEAVRSCLMFAVQAAGKKIRTVEGLADGDKLSVLQQAFIDNHGLQCGYCTPGFLMLATNVLEKYPQIGDEDLTDMLASNLCRCTGYQNIIKAVRAARDQMRGAGGGGGGSEAKTGICSEAVPGFRFAQAGLQIQRRQSRLRDFHILLDLRPAGGNGADDFAADLDRKAARHIGKIAHPHRHAQRVLLRRITGRQPLRGRGDGLALRGDDGEMPRAVHHQEGDQPAALVDHRERDLAAELIRFRHAGGNHFLARLVGQPVGGHKIRHGAQSLIAERSCPMTQKRQCC